LRPDAARRPGECAEGRDGSPEPHAGRLVAWLCRGLPVRAV